MFSAQTELTINYLASAMEFAKEQHFNLVNWSKKKRV